MRNAKRGIALLLSLAAVAGFTACGSDNDDTNAGTTASQPPAREGGAGGKGSPSTGGGQATVETIVVRDGEPVGGIAELEYDAGEQVRFRVRSNAADEVHVHGYELSEEVAAGGTASFSFPADIEGIFEVELHGSEEQIAELRVNP